MPVLVDLRPKRDLLDSSFGGYKLSLDPVPVNTKFLPGEVYSKQPDGDQFSFLHVKLFSYHNHLYVNPFTNYMYYIDLNWNVVKIHIDSSNKVERFSVVWTIPGLKVRKRKMYNTSIVFAACDKAAVSDGAGAAHVMHIYPNDNNGETWKPIYSALFWESEFGFVLRTARLDWKETGNELHFVFTHVEQKTDREKQYGVGLFHTLVEWITLVRNPLLVWMKSSQKVLQIDGTVDYVAVEPGGQALFLVCDRTPLWKFDSVRKVPDLPPTHRPPGVLNLEKLYTWMQTEDDVTVMMKTADDVKKTDLAVVVDSKYFRVEIKGQAVLFGELCRRVEKDITSWTLEKNKLEVCLVKHDSGQVWERLLMYDNRGEQVYDPDLVERVHNQLSHLCSDKEVDSSQPSFNPQQLEDCDSSSPDTVFLRTSVRNHSITHKVSLSAFQWLFNVQRNPRNTPALCLRHDVDACVWQFNESKDTFTNWPHEHVGTFPAFGYVQASKQKKKFMTCPENFSYVAICESSKHIYLYRQPSTVRGELRNRSTGERVETISKQQLITLDTNDQILGIHATNSHLYVLTECMIHVLTINE